MTFGSARRIVVIRTDRLGETLLAIPAVSALQAALPQASVTLLVHPGLRGLLTRLAGLDGVLAVPAPGAPWWASGWQVGRLLRGGRFDAAVVSNPKKELHLGVWLAGIPRRVGYARKWDILLTDRVPDRKALGERHEVEYNLELVRTLVGHPVAAPAPGWRWGRFEAEQTAVRRQLAQQGVQPSDPLVAVHPWSSNPAKLWPAPKFQRLIREAVEALGVSVALIGGPDERPQAATFPSGGRIANLVGALSLLELAALLQMARTVVSNDSGPAHLAAAMGTPAIVLFGTQDPAAGPRRWGPWGSGHTVIWKSSMEAISVDEVVAALARTLDARAAA